MKKRNLVLLICTIIMMFAPQILILFRYHLNINYNITSIPFYFTLPILIVFYIFDIKKKKSIDVFDILFYILIITSIITTIFSIYPYISIFGNDVRKEGLISILSYYALFINWKNNNNKELIRKVLKSIIILGILNSVYALLQSYTSLDFILRFQFHPNMATGLCVNPNFLGSLMVIELCIVSVYYLTTNKSKKSTIIVLILFFISLINCESIGPLFTYVLTLMISILYLYKNKKIKNSIIKLVLILIITFISVFTLNAKVIKQARCELCNASSSVNSGVSGRIKVWKNTFRYNVKTYWITGTGFENFTFAYPNKIKKHIEKDEIFEKVYIDDSEEFILDKAHNVYLNILADAGIINLIPYLLLCLLVFICGLKNKSILNCILLSAFVGYSIQAFASISVIQVAPIYYIIMGMIVSLKRVE